MRPDPARVAHRHMIRRACREAWGSPGNQRVASQLDRETFEALADSFFERTAGFGTMVRRLKSFLKMLRKQPRFLSRLKDMIGELTPENIRKWAQEGKKALGKVLRRAAHEFPLGIFFHPRANLPTLTDLIGRIMKETGVGEVLRTRVKPGVDYIDRLFAKYLPTLRRPVYAAIFAFIWFNVAEISWDFRGLAAGFTGAISLSELLGSLPESAVGAVAAAFGLGFQMLPVMLVARLLWLVAQNYIEWDSRSGSFRVHWHLLGAYGTTQ